MVEYKEHTRGLLIFNQYKIRRDAISFFSEMVRVSGDFCAIDFLIDKYYLINDPLLIREILVERPNEIIIKGGVSSGLARLIGHGILTNRGGEWRESRSALNPLFAGPKISQYLERVAVCCEESLARWRGFNGFDLNHELLTLILRANSSALFSYLPSFTEAEGVARAILDMQRLGLEQNMIFLDRLTWLPLPRAQVLHRARQTFFSFAERVRAAGANVPADEILSLLFAGSEAPASTLCWVATQLSLAPQWSERLRHEVQGFASESLSLELLKKHVECEKFLNETMRLYPSGWAFERYADTGIELRGVKIKRGARFIISPYLLHRNSKYWAEPEHFDPDRFRGGAPINEKAKAAYIPFGLGPRSCIGSRLAMSEMLIFIILLLRKHQLALAPEALRDLRPIGSFKLRLSHSVPAKIL